MLLPMRFSLPAQHALRRRFISMLSADNIIMRQLCFILP